MCKLGPRLRVRGGGGAGRALAPPPPPPHFLDGLKIFCSILPNHIHHLQKQLTLDIIKYIKVFTDKPDILLLVLLLNGRLDFNREIMEFHLFMFFFLYPFVLGSVFHEDKVSSLNRFLKFERSFCIKAFFYESYLSPSRVNI